MAKKEIKPVSGKESNGIEPEKSIEFPLTKLNFILMAIAGALIVVGFLLMSGTPSTADHFNPDIFSPRRIVVGPTIAFIGFLFMGFAIMWKSKSKKDSENL